MADNDENESYKEFTAEKDLSDDEQAKLVDKLDRMFSYALNHPSWITGRKKMLQCFEYREGDQWTSEELEVLKERNQPDTVNNQIAVVVNKLVGDLVNQRFRIAYKGRNAPDDTQVAEVLSDIFLYVRQSNDLEFEEIDMADDGFTSGFGVLETSISFDDLAQPEIKVRHEDPLIVFPDPDARRYDWNEDARFICRARWWDVDEAAAAFPQAKLKLNGVVSSALGLGEISGTQLSVVDRFKGEQYVDKNKQRLRIIEVQYKKTIRENLLLLSDGKTQPFEKFEDVKELVDQATAFGLQYKVIDRLKHVICNGVYAAGVLLEHKVTDRKLFSLVPYYAFRRKNGVPYSLITLALPMQDAVNKRESKALHLLNTNQVVAEKSAVDDKVATQQEVAKPDGYIEVRDGALRDQRFQINRNIELAQAQFAMHSRGIEDLYRILGIDPNMGRQTGEIRSGTGLQRKYLEASKPIAKLFNNVRRTRKILARVILDFVQNYFTSEKVFMITDNAETSRSVNLTTDLLQKIKTAQYDVFATDLEDTDTVQEEQFNLFAQTLPQILPFGPYWINKLIQLSNFRDKETVMKELSDQSGPPPIQPRMSVQANLDALTPLERAGVWELAGRPDIAQQVRQIQPPTTQETKGMVELTKEISKERQTESTNFSKERQSKKKESE